MPGPSGGPTRRSVVSIQDLGSLGEFLGGVAVVVSLVYLALQIRQNTRQVVQNTRTVHRESTRAFQEDANAWRSYLIQSPEIAELYRRGLRHPDELDPGEWLRFRMLMQGLFEHWRFAYLTREDAEFASTWEPFLEQTLDEPGGARYWETARANFPPEEAFAVFVDHVLERLRSAGGAA